MEPLCPTPAPDDPLVRGLIATVDCNVQTLVRSGYGALFEPSAPFAAALTTLMTIFVAVFGFQLLLGRAQLRVGDLAMTLVKLGIVLALTTQWATYQALVFRFLFEGPSQLASVMLGAVRSGQADANPLAVFDALQAAFDSLTTLSERYAKQAPATASPFLGGAGSGAVALTASGGLLLLSSLGVLLASKIVLGVLLAVGPVFIALLLFDTTRGLFVGWARAAIAFAFAPLAATLLLGVALLMLAPGLNQLAELTAQNQYPLGPVYNVLTLVLVFVAVSAGMLIAGGVVAAGFKLPERREAPVTPEAAAGAGAAPVVELSRADRVAAAAGAQDRRDQAIYTAAAARGMAYSPAVAGGAAGEGGDRRTTVNTTTRGPDAFAADAPARLGQAPRREARPRIARSGARTA